MQIVPPEEYIFIDTWEELAGEYDHLVYAPTDQARTLLCAIQDKKMDGITVITGKSDAGIHKQEEAHPNNDLLETALAAYDWAEIGAERSRYNQVVIGPTVNTNFCDHRDKYVSKCQRYSFCTFPFVPDEVKHWYTANLGMKHGKFSFLPFGVNDDGKADNRHLLHKYATLDKSKLLYVNFSENTRQRGQIKLHYYQNAKDWATVVVKPNLEPAFYLRDMAEHSFVLCPSGNGLDCFRTYEALYLGCVPVLKEGVFANHLLNAELPVLVVEDLTNLTPEALEKFKVDFFGKDGFDYNTIRLSYWKEKLCRP